MLKETKLLLYQKIVISLSIVLSQEEAIKEVFNALNYYIELMRSLNKLSNANIVDMKSLGFEGLIAKLEKCVQQRPALLDENHQCKIFEILFNFGKVERMQIKEVLGIDNDTCERIQICSNR